MPLENPFQSHQEKRTNKHNHRFCIKLLPSTLSRANEEGLDFSLPSYSALLSNTTLASYG